VNRLGWLNNEWANLRHHESLLKQWWAGANPNQRRRLLRALVWPEGGGRVVVYPPRLIFIVIRHPARTPGAEECGVSSTSTLVAFMRR